MAAQCANDDFSHARSQPFRFAHSAYGNGSATWQSRQRRVGPWGSPAACLVTWHSRHRPWNWASRRWPTSAERSWQSKHRPLPVRSTKLWWQPTQFSVRWSAWAKFTGSDDASATKRRWDSEVQNQTAKARAAATPVINRRTLEISRRNQKQARDGQRGEDLTGHQPAVLRICMGPKQPAGLPEEPRPGCESREQYRQQRHLMALVDVERAARDMVSRHGDDDGR